jgi:hypothetical protein
MNGGDYLRSYTLQPNGLLNAASSFNSDVQDYSQGGYMGISQQNTTTGTVMPGTAILWCYHASASSAFSYQQAVLEAYAPDTLDLLWSSNQNIGRDNCENFVKWNYPTVANGKVFVGTASQELVVYGLLNSGVPAVPSNVSAAINNKTIRVSWPSVPGAVAYNVRNSVIQGGPYNLKSFQQTGTSFSTGFLNTGSNTYNYYVVSAVNANGESANSVELAFSPLPASPVIASTSVNGVPTISWTAASQAGSYSILRGTQSGGPYTALVSGITALSYTDNSVAPNTKYYYVATATNNFGTSAYSNEVTN